MKVPKYELDTWVYVIEQSKIKTIEKCQICTRGRVIIKDKPYRCPICNGAIFINKKHNDEWKIKGLIKIERIIIRKKDIRYSNNAVHLKHEQLYEENNCFLEKDYESAKQECLKRNAEIKKRRIDNV